MKTYVRISIVLSVILAIMLIIAKVVIVDSDNNPTPSPVPPIIIFVVMPIFQGFFITGIFYLPIYFLFILPRRRRKYKQQLWEDYQAALHLGDRQKALAAGRLYYSITRGGFTTTVDETALNNDLMAMKVHS